MASMREDEKPWKTDLARKSAQRRENVLQEVEESIKKAPSFEDALRQSEAFLAQGEAVSGTGSFIWRLESGDIAPREHDRAVEAGGGERLGARGARGAGADDQHVGVSHRRSRPRTRA